MSMGTADRDKTTECRCILQLDQPDQPGPFSVRGIKVNARRTSLISLSCKFSLRDTVGAALPTVRGHLCRRRVAPVACPYRPTHGARLAYPENNENRLDTMKQWALIADIGGTNARFALTNLAARHPGFEHEQALTGSDYIRLADAARAYLRSVKVQPRHAALALASPLLGDPVALTNRNWSFRRESLRRALGVDRLLLLNDFTAIAWAVPHLTPANRLPLHGAVQPLLKAPITLIGAGTGLGMGLLVRTPTAGWQVVPTEGGHASFAPTDDEERTIAAWLGVRYGRTSNERLLSGAGLANIDAALRGVTPIAAPAAQPGARNAKDIVKAALAGTDAQARHALTRFCRIYGAVAGDAALLHGARTVLIAGGMVLHFIDFFRQSPFMESFVAKGRHQRYMETVAVQIIAHPNPGLLGAAVALRQHGPNNSAK